MSGPLNGKTALVTGASAGIGQRLAAGLLDAGARVIGLDLRRPSLPIEFRECDVSDIAAVSEHVGAVLDTGPIDVVVNNAGVFSALRPQPFWELAPDEWEQVFAVNVRGVFAVMRAVAPHLRPGASVVNIASGTVYKGTPGFMHYVASKGAVVAMTHCMARELGARGVRVNALAPGLVVTDAVRDNPVLLESLAPAVLASRALQRHETPDDLIGALLFLCSEASAFMTGQVLVVDGGSVMR